MNGREQPTTKTDRKKLTENKNKLVYCNVIDNDIDDYYIKKMQKKKKKKK